MRFRHTIFQHWSHHISSINGPWYPLILSTLVWYLNRQHIFSSVCLIHNILCKMCCKMISHFHLDLNFANNNNNKHFHEPIGPSINLPERRLIFIFSLHFWWGFYIFVFVNCFVCFIYPGYQPLNVLNTVLEVSCPGFRGNWEI